MSGRLHFAMGALSGVLAGTHTDSLINEFSQGKSMNDLQLIAQLASLMVATLKAPLPDATQLAAFAAVLGDATDGPADATIGHLAGNASAAKDSGDPAAPTAHGMQAGLERPAPSPGTDRRGSPAGSPTHHMMPGTA